MMPQAWFEMTEIRRRKFASSAWIPLRAVQPICEEGIQTLHQGQTRIANCAASGAVIASLLGCLVNSTCE